MEHVQIPHLISALALSLTFGGMTFFSAVVAPLVFTRLHPETAGCFIRHLFPWYYLTMGVTTLLALVAMIPAQHGSLTWEAALTLFVLSGFILARQLLMPSINRARDEELAGREGAGLSFARLHRTSVLINGLQWLATLAALVLMLS
jgi:hypothetical protein